MLRLNHKFLPLSRVRSVRWNSDSGEDKKNSKIEHPLRRTFNIIKNDLKRFKDFFYSSSSKKNENAVKSKNIRLEQFQGVQSAQMIDGFPSHCDVLVIGGGGVGSSAAYWLKKKAHDGLNVVVVERDPTYSQASTVLSVGGLRQQFSLPENIQMSLYGADFLRNAKENLGDVNVNFTPYGYLVLASEAGAETLQRNSVLQNGLGARNELLTPSKLKTKFPWIDTEGIALGCHGLEKEGWFDPWALLMGFKNEAKRFGAEYVHGEVVDFEFKSQPDVIITGQDSIVDDYNSIDKAVIRTPNGETKTIKFAICVLAAGSLSGQIARLAKIGTGAGILSVPLPVEPRKRYVYVFNTQGINAPGIGTPLTIDPDGTYFRCDGLGGNYLCGRSPSSEAEPNVDDLSVDHEFFENNVWPTLARRVKAFESAKVCSSWAGFYEFNLFDENGIIGPHPYYNNLFIATGFSGHGIQQTPAVGRAISELIIDGHFRTIDLSRLGFDRIIVDKPMFESNIF